MTLTTGPASTRAIIEEVAGRLFRERGFGGTVVRDIAREAGVDPALVIRYFGSKEQLFLSTMRLNVDANVIERAPLDQLGERFITYLLESGNQVRDVYLALVRASDSAGVGSRLRQAHEETFVAPLRARLTGADAELRARLAAALVGGLLHSLWTVVDEGLLAADRTAIARRYGALLQTLLTP